MIAEDLPLPALAVRRDDLTLSWANLAAQEWLQVSVKSMKGQALEAVFETAEGLLVACQKSQADLSSVALSDIVIKRAFHASEKCDVAVFSSGENIGICFTRIGPQTLRIDKSNDNVSALGRMLAHEIKNPLAGIHGAAQLLRDDVDTEEGLSLIDLIGSETDRIRRLADRMERLGDEAPLDMSEVNIHEILRQARRVIQSGISDDIVFSESYDPSLPLAEGDSDMLMQTLINLIKNAAEAIEGHSSSGNIRLETSYRSGVKRRLSHDGSEASLPIEIRIIDDGPGIPEDVREQIFQPFITSKPTGQGLGLALVSKIVAAHNGLIEVTSEPGHTVFSILLPRPKKRA